MINNDLDDIESENDVWIVEHPQPGKCAARDQSLFFGIHGGGRIAEVKRATRLNLDEDQRVTRSVTADDVHFAATRGPEVAIENLTSVAPQMCRSKLFSAAPQPRVRRFARFRRRKNTSAQPGKSCGDESGKVHWLSDAPNEVTSHSLCVERIRIPDVDGPSRS